MWMNVKNTGVLCVALGNARTPWAHTTVLWDVHLASIAHRLENALVRISGTCKRQKKKYGCKEKLQLMRVGSLLHWESKHIDVFAWPCTALV